MTSNTFVNPDGKLITHKKYVNWEGFREVEGVEQHRMGAGNDITQERADVNQKRYLLVDFTIQD